MPKISELLYAGELGAANYILGIRDGEAVRFATSLFQEDSEPIVNSSFTVLGDTPADYVDQAGKLVSVNATETALEFIDATTSLPVGGAVGQVLTKTGEADYAASWGDVVTTFSALSDTPSSYTGKGGKFVMVNTSATGLEYGDAPESGSSTDSSSSSKIFTYTHLEGGL